jgi:serine/threonine protein kinase
MMGTIDYMAPEQGGDSHQVDIRADIYSLGATLYRLLTGAAPFAGEKWDTPVKKILALATQSPTSIQERRQGVPAPLAAIVNKMLAKTPAARYATPEELAEALAPFCQSADLTALLARAVGNAVPGVPSSSFDAELVLAARNGTESVPYSAEPCAMALRIRALTYRRRQREIFRLWDG